MCAFEFRRITEKKNEKRKRRNYEEILKSQALEIVFVVRIENMQSTEARFLVDFWPLCD